MDFSQDFPMPNTMYRQLGQMTVNEIDNISHKYPSAHKGDEGKIMVFGMIRALNEEIRMYKNKFGTKTTMTEEELEIESALKHEAVLSKRIANQTKLSRLIPKEEATDRVKTALNAVITMTKNYIKNASRRLVNIDDPRYAEQIMTEEWNAVVEELRNTSKIISWEADGSSKLLQTRLESLRKIDSELDEGSIHGEKEES